MHFRQIEDDARTPSFSWDTWDTYMVAKSILLQDLGWAILERVYINRIITEHNLDLGDSPKRFEPIH